MELIKELYYDARPNKSQDMSGSFPSLTISDVKFPFFWMGGGFYIIPSYFPLIRNFNRVLYGRNSLQRLPATFMPRNSKSSCWKMFSCLRKIYFTSMFSSKGMLFMCDARLPAFAFECAIGAWYAIVLCRDIRYSAILRVVVRYLVGYRHCSTQHSANHTSHIQTYYNSNQSATTLQSLANCR